MNHLAVLLVRAAETFAAMAPSLLLGVLLAAAVAAFVPAARIRSALATAGDGRSSSRWGAASLGTVWGMLLPVCGMGLLPVLLVARRAGVSRTALAALAITGGSVSPFTLVYLSGLTALWKVALVATAVGVTGVLIGLAAGERAARPREDELPPARRLSAVAVFGGHFVLRLVPVYVLITVLTAASLATVLPAGWLGHLLAESDLVHVLLALAAAVVAYSPPSIAALQVSELLWQRADPGLAVGWWILAGGVSAGSLMFLPRVLGWSGLLRTLAATSVILVSLTLSLSPVLRDGPTPNDDTHAFDRHVRPYAHALTQHGPWTWAARQLAAIDTPELQLSVAGLLLLALAGGLPAATQSRLLTPAAANPPAGSAVSRHLAVAASGFAVTALALLLLYIRYPDPGRLLDEARHPDAELLSLLPEGAWDRLEEPLGQLQRRIDRLPLAGRLRRIRVPAAYTEAVASARAELLELREAVDKQDVQLAREHALRLTRALRSAERAWRGEAAR